MKRDKTKEKEKAGNKKRYEKIKKLGEGAYGSVTKVFDHEQNCMKALKKIKFTNEDEGIPISSVREVSYMRKTNHPNIIKYIFTHLDYMTSITSGTRLNCI